jgi:tetratricopeptide (TPR) repeat protein
MPRGVLFAGCGTALLALSGCVLVHPRINRDDPSAAQAALCQQLSQTAQAAIDRRDYERALSDLGRLVAESPQSAEAYHRLGRVFQILGRLDEAEGAYRRALMLDPEYVGALISQGEVDLQHRRPELALSRFEAAIEIDPQQAGAHLARGRVLEVLGHTEEATAAYFRTLELDPSSAPAILHIATLQLNRRQPEQALTRLDQVLELTPDDPEARHQRGRAHLALNHHAEAVTDLQFAANTLTNRPDILFHLALALDADKKPRDALAAAQRALTIAPNYADARDLTQKLRR